MVSAYLDVAEINALNMHAMTMKEWVKENVLALISVTIFTVCHIIYGFVNYII